MDELTAEQKAEIRCKSACDDCGETDFSPDVEAFEATGRLLCEDCAGLAFEDMADGWVPS